MNANELEENYVSGYIRLYRSIEKHWIFSNSNYFKAWIQMIFAVNHTDNKELIKNELVECKRGQSLLSVESWVEIFSDNWTYKKVRIFFELLEKEKMIKLERLRYTTKLTIINYDTYQNSQIALRVPKGQSDVKSEGNLRATTKEL